MNSSVSSHSNSLNNQCRGIRCIQGRAEQGGVPRHPTLSPPPTFLESVGILTKRVGKISWPNVVGKFGVFHHKNEMQNSINIQFRRNQTFTGEDGF